MQDRIRGRQKICLGTAQFGLDYGISNHRGKVPVCEVSEILHWAQENGINALDTAPVYGNSEDILGEIIAEQGLNYQIVSKMPDLGGKDVSFVKVALLETLGRLKQKRIYGYLVHRFNNVSNRPFLIDELHSYKEEGLVEKVGVSLYSTEELNYLLDRHSRLDIVQVPYSIFDRRFENYFQRLKENNVEIHVRSIFLQGLVFLNPHELRGGLAKAAGHLKSLKDISSRSGLSIGSVCLNFTLMNSFIDYVVIGIDSLGQLKTNINDISDKEMAPAFKEEVCSLSMDDEEILMPYMWGKA